MEILGIDIGASGIKAAVVNATTGDLLTDRVRRETPQPATPEAMMEILLELIRGFEWRGPIGCGFPGIVKHGVIATAANLDPSWVGVNLEESLRHSCACPVTVLNDADAAGLAEMRLGAGRARDGVVIVLTIGTGIGSALFINGHHVPNTELGHLRADANTPFEQLVSEAARERLDLKWKEWAKGFSEYLNHLELLFSPDLFILGGGGSRKFEKFEKHLTVNTEIALARFLNRAGIIGAAMAATGSWRISAEANAGS